MSLNRRCRSIIGVFHGFVSLAGTRLRGSTEHGIAGRGFNCIKAEVHLPASPTLEINPVFEFVRTWSGKSGPCPDFFRRPWMRPLRA
jgi:hypothetical protein